VKIREVESVLKSENCFYPLDCLKNTGEIEVLDTVWKHL